MRNNFTLANIFLIFVMTGLIFIGQSVANTEEKPTYTHTLTHPDTLQTFFTAHGSPVPSVMASAVLQTKNPNLLAAVAVKESTGTPWAVGDSGKSHGAFQVQEKHWGEVPSDAVDQALQAEKILEELVRASRGRLRQGLARYNGGRNPPPVSHRYAMSVLRIKEVLN